MTNIDNYNRRLRTILNSGEWWISPWWEDEYYLKNCSFSKREIPASFKILKKIFNKQWFTNERDYVINEALICLEANVNNIKKDPIALHLYNSVVTAQDYHEKFYAVHPFGFRARHEVFSLLIHPGTIPLSILTMLGKDIVEVEKAGLIGDFYKRLRDARQFPGAYFEVEILAILCRGSFVIERHPAIDSKRCDFKVMKDHEIVFLELKRLEPAYLNKTLSRLSQAMFEEIISDPILNQVQLGFELAKNLTEKDIYKLRATWPSIVCQLKEAIQKKIINREWGKHVVQQLAQFTIAPRNEIKVGGRGELSGLQLSPEAELKKLMSNAIEEGVVQLPKDQPALLIIDPPYTLMLDGLADALSTEYKEWQEYKNLSGIMLFDSHFQAEKFRYDVHFIKNRTANFDVSNYAIINTLLSLNTERVYKLD